MDLQWYTMTVTEYWVAWMVYTRLLVLGFWEGMNLSSFRRWSTTLVKGYLDAWMT